jgi:hypothetical protein
MAAPPTPKLTRHTETLAFWRGLFFFQSFFRSVKFVKLFTCRQPLLVSVSYLMSSKIVLFIGIRKTRTNPL